MKDGRKVSAYAICPYYKAENYRDADRRIIYCEGVEPNTALHLAFANKTQLLDYKRRFCESRNYGRCLLAEALERKWNER